LWKPTADELSRAGVVTRVTSGAEYAISGFGQAPTRESLSNVLVRTNAPYAATKELYPAVYAELLEMFFDAVDRGLPLGELRTVSRAKFRPFVNGLVSLADDDVVLEFARVQAHAYEEVGSVNPTACQEYFAKKSIEGFATALSPGLINREQAVGERVIRTAKQREKVPHAQATWDRFRVAMRDKGFGDRELTWITLRNVDKADHPRLCAMLVAYLRTTLDMPDPDAVILLRQFYRL
jgi:hypothetical protein